MTGDVPNDARQQLLALGYPEGQVAIAMIETDGTADAAIEWLMAQTNHSSLEPVLPSYSAESHTRVSPLPSFKLQPAAEEEPEASIKRNWFGFGKLGKVYTAGDLNALELKKWGPPGSSTHNMVLRYWENLHMVSYWVNLRTFKPQEYIKYLAKGYCEPISLEWIQSRKLAQPYTTIQGSQYQLYSSDGEQRLYFVLNHMLVNGSPLPKMIPINYERNKSQYVERGRWRQSQAVALSSEVISRYTSPSDVFQRAAHVKSHEYSSQVPAKSNDLRAQALLELAKGIENGIEHVKTMIMIDVSTSMTWDPTKIGDMYSGPHDQPPNADLVKNSD
ncbi:hypothetical protein HDU99_002267 [Rhizoclosmatium hyalinum]|nr:hypothetical protein HDU99_002267 [Rhizoclosmatium hyalinum]